jgi:hypothetical protein|tara:strand:+ start:2382 stop:2774 length:393 start_codon:yes stop_codon:yes gene_type:complete
MADSLVNLSNPRGNLVFRETAANATLEQDVFSKATSVIYGIKIDASQNSAEDVYLAIFENGDAAASGLTVGTDAPIVVVKCRAGRSIEVALPCGIAAGNGEFLHACVKTTAGTAGNTNPSGTVEITLLGE